MSLLFFLKPVWGGGGEEHYFQPYLDEPKRIKKKKIYTVRTRSKTAYAEEISLADFAKETFQLPSYLARQRQEEQIIVQLLLMDEL